MRTYIPTKEELEEIVQNAVEEIVTQKLPTIIRESNRKDYYTIGETCEILDVSKRHLQYLRDTEKISYVKEGRKIYFKAEDLEEFFNRNYINAGE